MGGKEGLKRVDLAGSLLKIKAAVWFLISDLSAPLKERLGQCGTDGSNRDTNPPHPFAKEGIWP